MGLLNVNGKFEKLLQPGSYGYWKFNRAVAVKLLDMRLQSIEVSGQEILTKDRVSLRVNLSGSYKVVNPKTVALKLNDYANFIYRELQLRLREAVGTQSLDSLLEDKDSLNVVVADAIRSTLAEYGIEMVSVGVKDIILPGDMKMILNQVVEAQKESEANLIRRREETQAMRSLHNTAKLMENNPILLRLKELEALERITERIDKISVYGGLDGVLNDLVKLAPKH
jgi:regulator of protease activity HflC (stomatin/prohibitin superfamily)